MSDPRTVNNLKYPGCESMAEPMQVPENVIYLLQGGFEFAPLLECKSAGVVEDQAKVEKNIIEEA